MATGSPTAPCTARYFACLLACSHCGAFEWPPQFVVVLFVLQSSVELANVRPAWHAHCQLERAVKQLLPAACVAKLPRTLLLRLLLTLPPLAR